MSAKKTKAVFTPGKALPGIITRYGVVRPGDIWYAPRYIQGLMRARFFVITRVSGTITVGVQEVAAVPARPGIRHMEGLCPDVSSPVGDPLTRRVIVGSDDMHVRISDGTWARVFRTITEPEES